MLLFSTFTFLLPAYCLPTAFILFPHVVYVLQHAWYQPTAYLLSAYFLPAFLLPAFCLIYLLSPYLYPPGHKHQRLAMALLRSFLGLLQIMFPLVGLPRSRLIPLPPTARVHNADTTTTSAGATTTSATKAAAAAAGIADPTAERGRPRPGRGRGSGQWPGRGAPRRRRVSVAPVGRRSSEPVDASVSTGYTTGRRNSGGRGVGL